MNNKFQSPYGYPTVGLQQHHQLVLRRLYLSHGDRTHFWRSQKPSDHRIRRITFSVFSVTLRMKCILFSSSILFLFKSSTSICDAKTAMCLSMFLRLCALDSCRSQDLSNKLIVGQSGLCGPVLFRQYSS